MVFNKQPLVTAFLQVTVLDMNCSEDGVYIWQTIKPLQPPHLLARLCDEMETRTVIPSFEGAEVVLVNASRGTEHKFTLCSVVKVCH